MGDVEVLIFKNKSLLLCCKKRVEIKIQEMGKPNSVVTFIRGVYYDEFKWSLVKSIGMFALGIRIAQECVGMELLPGP